MPSKRTSYAPEMLVQLDRTGPEPILRQLERGLREAVRAKAVRAGAALPSSRTLAAELGVSRGVVVEAYEQLVAEGYLVSRGGGKTRVARTRATPRAEGRPTVTVEYEYELRPGRPDMTAFPRDIWLRSFRRALASAPASRLSYLDGRGVPELRSELASYLNRVRGTVATADDVVITLGFSQGLALIAQALREDGHRRIAIEAASLLDARTILELEGMTRVPIPVDAEGIRVDLLDRARVGGVVVTPAHQYPTGAVLSPERRLALLAWADRHDGLVVEDDYDAEYRYDRQPVGALQGLRPSRVVYAGSASKVLAPGLRLGWLIAPTELATRLAAMKKARDGGSPALDQLTFADFIAHGELDRHLRRMRPIYRRRRDAVIAALARHLPQLEPVGAAAGLHILTWLPPGEAAGRIVDAAAAAGIGLGSLATDGSSRDALVFGYGAIEERLIEPGIRRLARIVGELRRSGPETFGAAPEGAAPMLSR
jgi:GntR family transcriptional regulator / MocR family aminotransferase